MPQASLSDVNVGATNPQFPGSDGRRGYAEYRVALEAMRWLCDGAGVQAFRVEAEQLPVSALDLDVTTGVEPIDWA